MNIKRLIAKGLRALLQPPAVTDSKIHKTSRVCSGTQVNFSNIDRYTYIGHDAFLVNAEIGPFCSLADNCRIGGAAHSIEYVSSSPVFNRGKNVLKVNFADFPEKETKRTTIGADVWVGANALILSGVTVGNGAVIGAGSVVTHDVPDYEIWAGNPARKIRQRFDEDITKGLKTSRWWEWSDERIREKAKTFQSPRVFLESIEGEKK